MRLYIGRVSSKCIRKAPPSMRSSCITSMSSRSPAASGSVSACKNKRISPCVAATPVFSCPPRPRFALITRVYLPARTTVVSLLPPSTTRISALGAHPFTVRRVRSIHFSSLKVGMMIESCDMCSSHIQIHALQVGRRDTELVKCPQIPHKEDATQQSQLPVPSRRSCHIVREQHNLP